MPANVVNTGQLSLGGGLLTITGDLTNPVGNQLTGGRTSSDRIAVGGTFSNSGVATFGNLTASAIAVTSTGQLFLLGVDHLPGQYSDAGTLSVSQGGSLFIGASTSLVIHDADLAGLRTEIRAGFDTGTNSWTGSAGSGVQPYLPTAGMGLAYATYDEVDNLIGKPSDNSIVMNWSTGDSAVVVDQFGDCNLDGTVDYSDFEILQAAYGGTNADWSMGDFDYDGVVGKNDFDLFLASYEADNGGATPDAVLSGSSSLQAEQFNNIKQFAASIGDSADFERITGTAVPEPSCLLPLSACLIPLFRRGKRPLAAR